MMNGASAVADWARDAVRVRRGPLPPPLKQRVLQTRAALFRRGLRTRPDSAATCEIVGRPMAAYSFKTLNLLFREAFVDLDYYFVAASERPTIIDCGSNIGMSILFFKALYPGATVLGFEPASAAFAILQENVARQGWTDVSVHNAAVGAEDGHVDFYEAAQGSLTASTNIRRESSLPARVAQRRVSTFVTDRVDLLKVDVEGAEWGVMQDLIDTGSIRFIEQMIVEYHHHIEPADDRLAEFLGMLQTNGFGYQIRAYMAARGVRSQFQDLLVHAYRKA